MAVSGLERPRPLASVSPFEGVTSPVGAPARRRKGVLSRAMKAVGKSPALLVLIGWYLGFCRLTARWELHGTGPLQVLAAQPGGFVMVFWHECLPLMPLAWARFWASVDASARRKPGLVLVSRSRDGALIATALGGYGLTPVAGSSSQGGREAARNLLRGVRSGSVAVVVPDGPRGPRRVVSEGAVRLASLAGVPIVPCGVFASPSRRLRSWDRMMFPLPFARCIAVVEETILPAGREPAMLAAALSDALDASMDRAARLGSGTRDAA